MNQYLIYKELLYVFVLLVLHWHTKHFSCNILNIYLKHYCYIV